MTDVNNPGQRAVAAAQSRTRAVEAIRAARQEPAPAPEPEQPQEPAVPADKLAAPQGAEAPATGQSGPPPEGPEGPAPDGDPAQKPADKPVAEPPKPAPSGKGPPEKTWHDLHEAEKRIAAERAEFKKEREAARNADEAVQAMQALTADPLAVLQQAGWDEEKLAGLLVERHKAGKTGSPPAPVAPPPNRWAAHKVEPPQAQPSGQTEDPRVAKLEKDLNKVIGFLGQTTFENAALRDPDLALIAETPGGVEFAIERAASYAEAAGRQLTPQEALAMAQEELIDQEKTRIGKLKVHPQWSKVLELDGSPAAPPSSEPDESAESGSADEPIATLSQSNTPTPPAPPIPAGHLTHQAAVSRAAEAIRRSRQKKV